MTTQVRRAGAFLLALFAALFINLNVIQVLLADDYANHPNNRRLLIDEYQIRRGSIIAGDQQIAYSEETDGTLKYLRRYDPPDLYSHLVGYYSLVYGRAGLEGRLNEQLIGTPTALLAENLADLLGQRDPVGNTVRLTVVPEVQQAAADALDGRPGAVVALDPSTGAVLAEYAYPTFDPNPLSSHDPEEIRAYWDEVSGDEREPMAARTRQRRYQPGSAMKVIVAAAALERGIDPDTSFEDSDGYTPPQTDRPIRNFGRGNCAGGGTITLEEAFEVSCNVVFAKLGVDIGDADLIDQAEAFGFNRDIPYLLPSVRSVIPDELDPPSTAQSAIGARDVQATPLNMAMVAAAIFNDGVLMRPYIVEEILDPSGRRVRGPDGGPWVETRHTAQAISQETADALETMMVRVVEEGTGTNAQISGAHVGGKTGTADPGEGMPSTVWFVGFASTGDGADDRQVAVAVVVPGAEEDATGGGVAAPIAQRVMEAALGR
jgi:penicillin-binding protein A